MPTLPDFGAAAVVARLRTRPFVPLFAREPWDPHLREALQGAQLDSLWPGRSVRDPRTLACAVAGLHLWNDDFHAAHTLCQAIDSPTGSYWHQLCHRREGHAGAGLAANLGNTRYWIRATGRHPAYPRVMAAALDVLEGAGAGMRWATESAAKLRAAGAWDPEAVADWMAQAEEGVLSPPSVELVAQIQSREIQELFHWCEEVALEPDHH